MKLKPGILIIILGAVLLVGSIIWSIIFETLLPLYREGDTAAFIANLIGIPVILTGTVLIIYGGVRVVKNMFTYLGKAKVVANIYTIQDPATESGDRGAARRGNVRDWLIAWIPGGPLMLLGFLLIGIGGYIINR